VEAGLGVADKLDIRLRGNLQGCEEHWQSSLFPSDFPVRHYDQSSNQSGDIGWRGGWYRFPLQSCMAQDPGAGGLVRRRHAIVFLPRRVFRRGDNVFVLQQFRTQCI